MSQVRAKKKQKLEVGIQVGSVESAQSPQIALFPASKPSKPTPFTLYSNQNTTDEQEGGQSLLLAESQQVNYHSTNNSSSSTGYSAQYFLASHDPLTSILTLHPTTIPLHSLSTSLNAPPLPPTLSSTQFSAQRSLLGTTFGTKKAIRNINAQARNKLDADSFGVGHTKGLQALQESITKTSNDLPSSVEIERTANRLRPIPPPNFDAETAAEVYNLHDIVSSAELDSLDSILPSLISASPKDRTAFLPFRRSTFLSDRLSRLLPKRETDAPLSTKERHRLKLLLYLSYLLSFHFTSLRSPTLSRSHLLSKISIEDPSLLIIDGLLERFAEGQRMGEERKSTSWTQTKLLAYLAVVVLKLDGWSTDVGTIAEDLGLGSKKVGEIFRSLGCTLLSPSDTDRQLLVQTGKATDLTQARKNRKAVLKVPLEFPKERKGAKKR